VAAKGLDGLEMLGQREGRSATALWLPPPGDEIPPFRWQTMRQARPFKPSSGRPLTLEDAVCLNCKIPPWQPAGAAGAYLFAVERRLNGDVRRIGCSRSFPPCSWTVLAGPAALLKPAAAVPFGGLPAVPGPVPGVVRKPARPYFIRFNVLQAIPFAGHRC